MSTIVSDLDDNLVRIQCNLLRELCTSLEDAQNKVNAVVEKDSTFSSGFRVKKASWIWKKKALDTIIADLEAWQRRFDPSWIFLMKSVAPLFGNERSNAKKGPIELRRRFTSPINPLALTPGFQDAVPPELSKFKLMCLSALPNEWCEMPYEVARKHNFDAAGSDTFLQPSPPELSGRFDYSPSNNASSQEAEEGEKWCKRHHLCRPVRPDQQSLNTIRVGNIKLLAPPSFHGTLIQVGLGIWEGSSYSGCLDTCITSSPPLYSVSTHSPLMTWRTRTIYYEVNILSNTRPERVLALGFNAPPYPSFRLPGWHRGSVAIHGDDGHISINDLWGGRSFTRPFKRGETLGIGIDLSPGQGGDITVKVFFTRNGTKVGSWDIHEEADPQYDQPLTGLEGFHDLCAAIGVCDAVSFEVVFAPNRWKWKGYNG
ncbi:hypothetical protein G7054_g11769 [Neopestalotiopsis clavispora]|nr:hypothetical protein G7054_g11769 [Neopestalotiopsis clavispora]